MFCGIYLISVLESQTLFKQGSYASVEADGSTDLCCCAHECTYAWIMLTMEQITKKSTVQLIAL